jgi:hypothetical protein
MSIDMLLIARLTRPKKTRAFCRMVVIRRRSRLHQQWNLMDTLSARPVPGNVGNHPAALISHVDGLRWERHRAPIPRSPRTPRRVLSPEDFERAPLLVVEISMSVVVPASSRVVLAVDCILRAGRRHAGAAVSRS